MSQTVGASTKGWIKNNVTGETKSFQYNPPELSYGRSASYVGISSPGSQYPNTVFVKGNAREFPIELFLYDNPHSGEILSYMNFIGAFLPPENNTKGYVKPPDMTFCYGYFIRKCVLIDLDIRIEEWDANLQPTQARFTLQLRQVGT